MISDIDWEVRAAAHPGLTKWLAIGERGMSSEAIVSHCTGLLPRSDVPPFDFSDFIRCELLLRQAPTLRPVAYSAMPSVSETWRRLSEEWDDIVAAAGDFPWVTSRSRHGHPELSKRILSIHDEVRKKRA